MRRLFRAFLFVQSNSGLGVEIICNRQIAQAVGLLKIWICGFLDGWIDGGVPKSKVQCPRSKVHWMDGLMDGWIAGEMLKAEGLKAEVVAKTQREQIFRNKRHKRHVVIPGATKSVR
jgi:hypothetical protein